MTQETLASLVPYILILITGIILGGVGGIVIASSLQGSKSQPNRNLRQAANLWRDKRTGRLVIQIEDRYFASVDKFTARQRTEFMQTLQDLMVWLGVDINLTSPSQMLRTGQDTELERLREISNLTSWVNQPLPMVAKVENIEPVKVNVAEVVTSAINPKTKSKGKQPPMSIAAQVDEILQKRLADSAFRDRLIRLVDAPGGGVEVLIDLQKYDGVSEVPDPAVRELIQDCVREWENKKQPL